MATLTGLRLERARASAQFHEGRFRNTARVGPRLQGNALPIMKDFFFGARARVPQAPLPVESPLEAWTRPVASGFRATWLGHSTVLLEVDGLRVLTDPVFGERASPVSFAGAKRFHPVPVKIRELPKLDAILLSHDHYDHLCESSIVELAKLGVPIVTSLGVGAHLERLGFDAKRITELDWWEAHTLAGGELSFRATPAQHFSGRGLTDRNSTLWSSWVLTTKNRRVFFSGDTGLTEEFREIGRRVGPLDLALIEIGAYHPAWGTIHLGPENALAAFDMLGAKALLPVHWSTFDLALHPWDEPAEALFTLAKTRGSRILTPLLGRPFEPDHVDEPVPWWRSVTKREGAESPARTVSAV